MKQTHNSELILVLWISLNCAESSEWSFVKLTRERGSKYERSLCVHLTNKIKQDICIKALFKTKTDQNTSKLSGDRVNKYSLNWNFRPLINRIKSIEIVASATYFPPFGRGVVFVVVAPCTWIGFSSTLGLYWFEQLMNDPSYIGIVRLTLEVAQK